MTDPVEIAKGLTCWVKTQWCNWTHGGGHIERDDMGRINWRCAKCGRWGDSPVKGDNSNYPHPLSAEEVRAVLQEKG